MNYKNYKIKGIEFFTINDELCCEIDQCGVKTIYPFPTAKFQNPAKFVLMDLDGTTVKSEEFWIWVIEKTVKKLLNDPSFSLLQKDVPFVSGFSTIEHLDYCIKKYGIKSDLLQANATYHEIAEYELNEIMQGRGNMSAFQPREGLKDFLYELKNRGIKIGLVTSGLDYKAIPEIMSVFRNLNMGNPLDFYDAIITGGKRKQKGQYGTIGELAAKPHPWVYAELAAGLGIADKSQAIVLEDSSAGLIAGRLAGFDVIGFNDGNILASGMSEQTFAMVNSFEEVLKIL